MSSSEQTPFVDCSATQVEHCPLPPLPENFASAKNSDENHVNASAPTDNPARNKTSNGVVEVGRVMGVVASPALSDSIEASPKFQDESSSRAAADGSTSTSQVPANLLRPQNHVARNATSNPSSKHSIQIQRRFNHRGIHNGNGGPFQAPAPFFPRFQVPPTSYCSLVSPMLNASLQDPFFFNNNWNQSPIRGYSQQPHPVNNDHGMSRGGNPHMYRNNVYKNNPNRPDHGRGSFVGGRNVHMHQQRPPPGNVWGPSTSSSPYTHPTHFFPPQPEIAYCNCMFYQDFFNFQQVSFDAFPLEHHRASQFMPEQPNTQSISEPSVSTLLVNQINYYFCDDNLVHDPFLKSHMDDQGWVSIDLVAGFPRVKKLTNDIPLILDSLKASTVVEIHGEKIRRRNEWIKWISNKNPTHAHPLSLSKPSQDLETNLQDLKMEEVVSSHTNTNGS